jgi:hypothetical protein
VRFFAKSVSKVANLGSFVWVERFYICFEFGLRGFEMGRFMGLMPEVLRRFPVAVLCCVLAFVLNANLGTAFGKGFVEAITLVLVAVFLASGAAQLFAEARKWAVVPSRIFAAVVGSFAGYVIGDPALFQSYQPFLFLGLALMLFVAPYVRRNVEQGAVWLFGMRLRVSLAERKGPHPAFGHLLQQEGWRRDFICIFPDDQPGWWFQCSPFSAPSCVEKVPNGRMRFFCLSCLLQFRTLQR